MQEVHLEDLGKADKIWADKDETQIIGGKGSPEEIKKRIALIKNELSKATNDFDREKLEERLAKLSAGAAIINVGASTETELKEKLERVKDAVGATKAAMEEGIVPGGGVALLRAREVLHDLKGSNKDEDTGIMMVYDALQHPIYKLMENAGLNGEHIALEILDLKHPKTYGYDVLKNEYGDMVKMGIIDPVKVTKGALQNGASVAMMILTTEALIAPDQFKETPDEAEI
jgi:chaperonin GroEL